MSYSSISGLIGSQPVNSLSLLDTVQRQQMGTIFNGVDPYWGAGEFMYVRFNGTVRQYGLVTVTPVLAASGARYNAVEIANTAGLGSMVAVSMVSATVGQFGWVCLSGAVPINSTASIAADTAFGITAAGQVGAIAAGKQICAARIAAPATTTVVKAYSTANAASNRLRVTNSDGWFIGIYLSGTGIAAATTVIDISPDGTLVTLSANTTAIVNGSVTGTYNNAVVFYNLAFINRSFAQGQIL